MKLTETQKQRLMKAIKYLALSIATAIAMALGLTSCNVTRTITTESRSLTRGDTAIIIQSKTIEWYNAMKHYRGDPTHISSARALRALHSARVMRRENESGVVRCDSSST